MPGLRTRLFALGILSVLLASRAGTVTAQPPEGQTVRLFLRTPSEIPAAEVEAQLKEALDASGNKTASLKLNRIYQSEYETMLKLTNADPASLPVATSKAELVMLRSPYLRIPRDKKADVVKVVVQFENAEDKTYTLKGDEKLRLLTGEWYEVPLPKDAHPVSYKAYYAGNEKADAPDLSEQLSSGRYFSAIIGGLQTELSELSRVLKDKKYFGNPVVLSVTAQQTFVFADAVTTLNQPPGPIVRRDKIDFSDPNSLQMDTATRMWIYLPVTEADAMKIAAELNSPKAEFNAFTLSKDHIRKNVIGAEPGSLAPDSKFTLDPGMTPGWIEIPKNANKIFHREIGVQKPNDWLMKYKDLWYVVAYEFQPDPNREKYQILRFRAEAKKGEERSLLVVPRKIDKWAEGLGGK